MNQTPTAGMGRTEQSQRAPIYRTYARELLRDGRAYPCFCTHDELAELSARQQAAKATPGYCGEWARCRHLTANEVLDRLRLGIPYTLRFRSPGEPGQRVAFVDAIRGELSHIQNMNDVVLLKSPASSSASLPTYHFAHVVDDHLMRVTHVIRGEEWISSVPLHLQLFHAIGASPVNYAHVAPLMKMEGSSRRKLSKRKDPEASVDYYIDAGYPAGAVRHYLRGLANSRLAELSFAAASAEPLRLDEFSSAGPLFDLVKLDSISQDYISEMTIEEVEAAVTGWSRLHDSALAQVLDQHHALMHRVLSLERSLSDNPRKDLTKWSDFRRVYGLFFPGVFADVLDPHDPRFAPVDASTVRTLAADFARLYSDRDDKETWFRQIRELATAHGFAATAGEFKRAPAKYAGSIRDASNVVRVALTGRY